MPSEGLPEGTLVGTRLLLCCASRRLVLHRGEICGSELTGLCEGEVKSEV